VSLNCAFLACRSLVRKLFHSPLLPYILHSVTRIVTWLLSCGCQSNAVPDSEYSGFGFMPIQVCILRIYAA
jgi:hypothetical protein